MGLLGDYGCAWSLWLLLYADIQLYGEGQCDDVHHSSLGNACGLIPELGCLEHSCCSMASWLGSNPELCLNLYLQP